MCDKNCRKYVPKKESRILKKELIFMEIENIKNKENDIINFFDSKINNVIELLYNYNLFKSLPKNFILNEDEREKIIENIINYYLKKISELNKNEAKIKNEYHNIQEVIDYFSYLNDSNINEKQKNSYSIIEDNGECIADDLISKLFINDKRKITFPIKYNIIKQYCISSLISEENIDNVFFWIILKLSATYNFLKYNLK